MSGAESCVQVPVACTLDGGAAKERVGRWRAILDSHGSDKQLVDDTLTLRFRRDGDAERELADLVAAERECCAFVGWQLDVDRDDLVLLITGAPDDLAALNFVG